MIGRAAVLVFSVFISASVASAAAPTTQSVENSLGMRFVPVAVPGGKPVSFSIWKTRIKDFAAFVNETHYDATKDCLTIAPNGDQWGNHGNWNSPGFAQTDVHPVCGVNWFDGVAFCEWLSKKEGKHYRLPTDREWSCAVGIGDKERAEEGPRGNDRKIMNVWPWGTQWPPPKGAGNFTGEECKGVKGTPGFFPMIKGYRDDFVFTSPVGSFAPNSLGICDMAGNVFEWCDDWMDADHRHRVMRGSSWADCAPEALMSSFRRHLLPESRGITLGFRVVIEP